MTHDFGPSMPDATGGGTPSTPLPALGTTSAGPIPIETCWRGYRFRSRVEARWAVFFETLGLPWEYEPEGFELSEGSRYLPDFRVRYPGRGIDEIHFEWFEVKGDLTAVSDANWHRMNRWEEETQYRLTLLDETPDLRMYLRLEDLTRTEQFSSEKYQLLQGREYTRQLQYRCEVYKRHLPVREELMENSKRDRAGWALWSSKGRQWWDQYENFFPHLCPDELIAAVNAARAARFEFADADPLLHC